ncbi:beta-ketoacyl synthase N-terminal-like domain-containing protein [Janthinobacterium fluminis]|uniref:Beta-ketoacyl synthase N-terminal-like domain-containing protein n=1 Tax=Janthinobacterium fluminis TaxID=2987524 RepID=A0ABT5K1V6_9BURK|nr:beta-ketoacyl synthase N-terminal-like domain-containing protein [Janthinobacterium fluminis]MDC8758945.1 beta-ketoacyl synthase N-terminal-like domain-containing protein [Janthinobacterium fluminis]
MSKPLDIAITAWETISPLGAGAQAFAGAAAGAANLPEDFVAAQYPSELEYKFAPYEGKQFLGKGTRTMDRTTALAVGTAKLLFEACPFGEEQRDRSGFILGTSTGSIRSTSDFMRDSLVGERPFLVNPALFPNTVMNCAAGQCAIWFKARGVNATIAAGRLSGFMSLQYASMMLRRGYADMLYTGAVEELCPQTAWAHQILGAAGERLALPQGEGCAMFALERASDVAERGGRAATTLYALHCQRYFDATKEITQAAVDGVVAAIREVLARFKFGADDIGFISIGATSDKAAYDIERAAVEAYFGRSRLSVIDVVDRVGETYSAAFSFKLAGLLGHAGYQGEGNSPFGIVLSATHDGYVGVALVCR